jgi:hypothetical protein
VAIKHYFGSFNGRLAGVRGWTGGHYFTALKHEQEKIEEHPRFAAGLIKIIDDSAPQPRSTVVDLRATINDQNEKVRAAELAGAEAQAMQGMVDSMATQLDNAEALISRIQRENIDLRERTKDLTVCETYELCLRSIAGVLP